MKLQLVIIIFIIILSSGLHGNPDEYVSHLKGTYLHRQMYLKENRTRVFENKVLRGMFGSKEQEEIKG
jgi:hypothetical protein